MTVRRALRNLLAKRIPAKIATVTAILVAAAALINGVHDIYIAVANIPTNIYDRTNEKLREKHFGTEPLVAQPVVIKSGGIEVRMILHVYDNGDIFVRYGDFQQWLPFKEIKMSGGGFVPKAFAQVPLPAPREPVSGSILIDIDRLKREKGERTSPPTTSTIEKSYLLDAVKDDHSSLLGPSRQIYSKEFAPEPGYKIVSYHFELASSSNGNVRSIDLLGNGEKIRIVYELRSGPAVDRWRGWLKGILRTVQQRST